MFNGYFKNIDYRNLDETEFLKEGEQTKVNDRITQIANSILGYSSDEECIKKILEWEHEHHKRPRKFARTAAEIADTGTYCTGCCDFALLFETIARKKGIPTIHVQAAKKQWVESLQNNTGSDLVEGHHFCECFIKEKNKWILVDPAGNMIFMDYNNENFNIGRYYVFAKSTDVFETGIYGQRENNDKMRELFQGFDIRKFKQSEEKDDRTIE